MAAERGVVGASRRGGEEGQEAGRLRADLSALPAAQHAQACLPPPARPDPANNAPVGRRAWPSDRPPTMLIGSCDQPASQPASQPGRVGGGRTRCRDRCASAERKNDRPPCQAGKRRGCGSSVALLPSLAARGLLHLSIDRCLLPPPNQARTNAGQRISCGAETLGRGTSLLACAGLASSASRSAEPWTEVEEWLRRDRTKRQQLSADRREPTSSASTSSSRPSTIHEFPSSTSETAVNRSPSRPRRLGYARQ